MGTRSLTYVHDDDTKQTVLVCIYRQMDGYPDGLGKELAEFLKGITLINGIGMDQQVPGKFANGMGCLAAQVVDHMKDNRVGSVYLYPVDTTDAGSEYHYHIRKDKNGQLELEILAVRHGKIAGIEYVSYDTPKLKRIIKGAPAKVLAAINENKLAKS